MVCQTFLLDPILYAVTLHTWIFMPACLTADMLLIVPYCAPKNLTKQQLQEYLYFSCDITFFLLAAIMLFPGAHCADMCKMCRKNVPIMLSTYCGHMPRSATFCTF